MIALRWSDWLLGLLCGELLLSDHCWRSYSSVMWTWELRGHIIGHHFIVFIFHHLHFIVVSFRRQIVLFDYVSNIDHDSFI